MGMAIRRWRQPPKDGCIIIAPGWLAYLGSVAEEESTAEERLYKSRKIILASWVSRPAIGSGVPPAREMGRMRSAYRVTEKCRRSATMPMWRWHFYNRSLAVVAHASVSRGRRTNPVLTYETALRRFSLCATSFYNRSSSVFPLSMLIRRRCAYSERGRSWKFFQIWHKKTVNCLIFGIKRVPLQTDYIQN